MLHIVFQQPDIEVLQKAIELDAKMQGEIWEIKDDFATGPLANIYEAEGYQRRRDWWKNALEFSPYTEQLNIVDDKMTVHQLKKKLEDEPEDVWLWMGQNAHDVCGYYWLMSQLAEYQGRIYVLYLNNLPFINEKGGLFYPTHLSEIQPKEFLKAKKLARPITTSEFEIDPDEWKKICNENGSVRVLEGGKKLSSKDEDFYDSNILTVITNEAQKLPRLLQQFFAKTKIQTGDVFVVLRIRKLAAQGILNVQGDWTKGWKDITVSLVNYKQTELYAEGDAIANNT